MARFVDRVAEAFPGFFSETHENIKERLNHLQHYAHSYLNKSGKMSMLLLGKHPKTTATFAILSSPPQPTPAVPNVIKVERPKPKPLYRGKPMNTAVDVPMPLAPPLDEPEDLDVEPLNPLGLFDTGAKNSTPAPAQGSPQRDVQPSGPAALKEFLAECCPSMEHWRPAFERAGVVDMAHLVGMASWTEERIRNFIVNNEIVHTALEEEAIFLGISGLLS
ncbi:hypothetical protein B0H13DRAFT_1981373 [Mycena leptocephala]|nr:hypothetical protein B0H13DRAFT_1981373 [Mycena leptocephala]